MNRRGFLSALIGAGVAAAADPEKLLWTPGKKLISIPKATIYSDTPMVWFIEEITLAEFRRRYFVPTVEAIAERIAAGEINSLRDASHAEALQIAAQLAPSGIYLRH
jgi:hypothetical protein